jgi:hypothetical protein
MAKEVKLKPTKAVKKEVKEVKKEAPVKKLGTPQEPEELKQVLSEEEINVANSKKLRQALKGINHNDLTGYIVLYNDHKTGRIAVMSSVAQAVAQFVALAHSGYIDKYDQIINQCITTRTIERISPQPVQGPEPLAETNEPEDNGTSTPAE